MKESYEGIGHLAVTVRANACQAGQVCKFNTQGYVEKCSAGDVFCGVVEAVDRGYAAMQVEGFVTLPYTGTAPGCGLKTLAANGTGGIQVNANGKEFLVVAVDAAKSQATIKL